MAGQGAVTLEEHRPKQPIGSISCLSCRSRTKPREPARPTPSTSYTTPNAPRGPTSAGYRAAVHIRQHKPRCQREPRRFGLCRTLWADAL
jgi:hypothetical protein